MFNHEIFAVSMGRALAQLRAETPDRAAQKAALRAVHDLTSLSSAALRLYDGVLSIDDIAIAGDLPAIPLLVERLHEHGLAEVTIARGAPPADLLVLLRTLAAEPERTHDAGTVKRRLGKAAAASIVVLPVKGLDAVSGRRAASVTQAFEQAAIEEAAAEHVPAEPAPAEPARRRTIRASAAAPSAAPEPIPLAQPGAPAAEWLAASAVRTDTPLGAALQAVILDPYGDHILDHLAELGRAVERALRDGDVDGVARALAAVVALEPGAPEGTPRSSYAITLRRALTRSTLDRLARLATNDELGPVVAPVLYRGGADGVDALLALLTSAETMRERKAYMTVLRGASEGTDRVLAMLYRPEWFVVRNVAELAGELRLEDAVPPLSELLGHEDARVRRAVAAALAKIGTVPTVEPLRRELRDGTPELRAFVASCIGGPHARALAMPLVALAEEETEPMVLVEYYGALGRIGTPEAVQALSKAAQSTGRLLRRTPSALRVAAVEALRHAGGPAARRALEALVKDGDRTVRAAAEKALGALSA